MGTAILVIDSVQRSSVDRADSLHLGPPPGQGVRLHLGLQRPYNALQNLLVSKRAKTDDPFA